ncbi:LytTR family DNA-binding domain-containing protein [Mesorhizobium sp. L-8-3]|uniref:LytTR family DNA-binding domain-containing protein n=1 Tax=Mesorhizobium sp. L-8-3 TaxID=2744522 RepID=UPI001926A19F|nr:LytTR family DNA-binding domain-containing protein [Mesorhizobium sp. L-8-3]BCH24821.1 hypothetical protein MesoLjLb_46060 [Mesorhizobium sp. L-8-3]
MTADPSDALIDERVARRGLVISAFFFPVVALINAASMITDAERTGVPLDPRVPWILELTSVSVLVLLVPLVARLERRTPFTPDSWPKALLVHALGSAVFSILHVGGMILLRKLVFAVLLGYDYTFFDNVVNDSLYEYRKDILPYAAILLVLSLVRSIEEHRQDAEAAKADAGATGRLTLKCGGRTIWLDARSLEWARAAGNYVDLRANGKNHLARISLAALTQQLSETGIDAVQVHRSCLVNRDKVVEVAPLRDGDFRIRMADGTELRGSRRYRHILAAD